MKTTSSITSFQMNLFLILSRVLSMFTFFIILHLMYYYNINVSSFLIIIFIFTSIIYFIMLKYTKQNIIDTYTLSNIRILLLSSLAFIFHQYMLYYSAMHFGVIRVLLLEFISFPSEISFFSIYGRNLTLSSIILTLINILTIIYYDIMQPIDKNVAIGLTKESKFMVIALLILSYFIEYKRKSMIKKYWKDFGGPKKFQALNIAIGSLLLIPLYLYSSHEVSSASITIVLASYLFGILFFGIPLIFIDNGILLSMDVLDAHLVSNATKLIAASTFDIFLSMLGFSISEFLSCKFLFFIAPGIFIVSELLHRNTPSSLLPRYVSPQQSLPSSNQSSLNLNAKLLFRSLWDEPQTRHLMLFVVANFSFMLIELFYGLYSLISDSGHMFIDCMGLVIGLYAAYLSKIKPNEKYNYGYGRYETLSGFVNGIFLLFIAYFVIIEALERFISPPDIQGEQLILVSVLGFFINIFGLLFFHHSHGHSHEGHSHDHNMMGIYMHILADTLGSLGVITSSILIRYFSLTIFDPICSLFISFLIILSVYPLVRDSGKLLLQISPSPQSIQLKLKQVLFVPGVLGYKDPHFWVHSSDLNCGTIVLKIHEKSDKLRITTAVTSIFQSFCNVKSFTIELQTRSNSCFETIESLGLQDKDYKSFETKVRDGHCNHSDHSHDDTGHHECTVSELKLSINRIESNSPTPELSNNLHQFNTPFVPIKYTGNIEEVDRIKNDSIVIAQSVINVEMPVINNSRKPPIPSQIIEF